MHSGRVFVAGFLTTLCGLLAVLLNLWARWPWWTWLPQALALALVYTLAAHAPRRRPNPVPLDLEPHLPVEPVERLEQRVSRVALPSGRGDYDFLFSATVRWCRTGRPAAEPVINPGSLAVDAVLARATEITARREPDRASLVQHELNGALGRMFPDLTGYLYVMADGVTLTLSEADQERLDKLAAIRKNEAVWEHERKYEKNRRDYLGRDVLASTGNAVVWWLSRNDDHVEKTVQDLGLLAQLSSAANNTDVPERYRHLVPQPPQTEPLGLDHGSMPPDSRRSPTVEHFDQFLRAAGVPEGDQGRPLIIKQVAEILGANGKTEGAGQLLEFLDDPDRLAVDGFELLPPPVDSDSPSPEVSHEQPPPPREDEGQSAPDLDEPPE